MSDSPRGVHLQALAASSAAAAAVNPAERQQQTTPPTAADAHAPAADITAEAQAPLDALSRDVYALLLRGCPASNQQPLTTLIAQAQALEEQGALYKTYPLLCRIASAAFDAFGPRHPHTLKAVFRVNQNLHRRGLNAPEFYPWLLPRVSEHWGSTHPCTRSLVQQIGVHISSMPDPREASGMMRRVTELAQQLPGGLRWGTAAVTPLPDVEAYHTHAMLQARAEAIVQLRDAFPETLQLAKDMLQRCITYFNSLGAHWLASPRKCDCRSTLALCTLRLEGRITHGEEGVKHSRCIAAEALLFEARRTAQRELGGAHPATVSVAKAHAECLSGEGRADAALSVLQKSLAQQQQAADSDLWRVHLTQITIAHVLWKQGKLREALSAAKTAHQGALRALGPNAYHVNLPLSCYWRLLYVMGKTREARQLKRQAAQAGCDTSVCSVGYLPMRSAGLFQHAHEDDPQPQNVLL